MSTSSMLNQLINRFENNLDAYKSPKYNETQLRLEFINPLFELLGWDVSNKKGYAEAYKDVIHEDAIKVGGATKAPDYSFRIGGARKFFLETKRPAVNIKDDPEPAFQLRRYAWSAKLPLSILTDFEEFAVYDCRIKPAPNDKPSTGRIMYFNYKEYPEKWEEISSVFSREAILKGSFDRYVESEKKKRGTAEVDDAFLKEIESWRDALARNIALRNEGLTERDINYAVQLTIDRIIFLRICEDRGIEDYGRLQALVNGEHMYKRMFNLFYRADEKYNSGLFHFQSERGRPGEPDELTPDLKIDDKVLKDIIKGLYYPESPYEFSVLPVDILGHVYEQFLGKVIRLTAGGRAKVEEKPEVRKAGGVYYTPKYIVDYIVKNTVGKLVEGKKPKQVEKISILDPACGSGSFLIGAYEYLLDWHRDWYVDNDPAKYTKQIYQGAGGQWYLTTAEKKKILLNTIYGVDIDPQAVEVTKLNLLLKALEGESEETIESQLKMFRERALPDLRGNIKCGNSLIGPDFYDNTQLDLLEDEERYRINAFDWEREFGEVMKSGGFDCVIGNPPYVIITNDIFHKSIIDYYQKYDVAQYKTDLYHLFLERGLKLLSKDGLLGYIVPNPWFTLKFTNQLREFILKNTCVEKIVKFDHEVFENADVHTALIFLRKVRVTDTHEISIKITSDSFNPNELLQASEKYVKQTSWLSDPEYRFELRQIGKKGDLVRRLVTEFPELEKVARASLGIQAYNSSKHTKEQIKNRVFHANRKLSKEYLPELAGNDVSRYIIQRKKGQWIKYGPWLHDFRTMDWLTGPRILVREIPGKPPYQICGSYIEDTYCNYKTILNVNPSSETDFSMKYLLGILNSRLISFLYPLVSNKIVSKSFPRISVRDLKRLPIRTINFIDSTDKSRHDRMVYLVDKMLELHKQLAAAKSSPEKTTIERQIDATDKQIDELVYELYGLGEEERRVVEVGEV